jgi:FkbM family methyltransferase
MKLLCFDIGCNKGLYIDANLTNFKKFIAIDANPSLTQSLKEKYNNNSNITIINTIVSSNNEETFYICNSADTISTCDLEWINNSRFSKDCKWTPINNIPTISIDTLITQFGIPDRIKIDVEGYELNVCKSLTQKIPEICFEWAEEKIKECIETIEYLYSINFTKFHLQYEDKYNYIPTSFITKDEIIKILSTKMNPNRKFYWGMIWCL